MRRTFLLGVAAVAFAAAGIANAAVSKLGSAGSWSLYGGTTDSGKGVCSMSTSGKGLYFGVKYYNGDDALTIQISHDDWKLKDGVKVKTTMKFDRESPWSVTATGFHMSDGDAAVEFEIPNKNIDGWLGEFAAANAMVLGFPDERSISDWKLDLGGTSSLIKSFGSCIKRL